MVQETFLSAYQSLNSFKGDSLFFTWLYRIAFNTAISFKRKQRGMLRLHAGGADAAAIDPIDLSEGSQPGHALERAEEERRIQRALNRLSPEHRVVLIMKDIEGQKYDVIANVLGYYHALDSGQVERAGRLLDLDKGDPEDVKKRLVPLASDSPWRYGARELQGLLALRAKDEAQAKQIFADLAGDAAAPAGTRARAAEILAALGGAGSQ